MSADRPDTVDPLSLELGHLEYHLRCASARCAGAIELVEDPKVRDALKLLWAELRVARRRADNVGKFVSHPASRRVEP